MPRKKAPVVGVTIRGDKKRVNVRVNGKLYTTTLAGTATDQDVTDWRAKQQEKYGGGRAASGSFFADIQTFLEKPQVAAQKYVSDVARELQQWAKALGGDRPRASIQADEIEAVIQQWLTRYKESTVYHRRSALFQLYRVLDGEAAVNPVKDTTCPAAWTPADHSAPFATLQAIVDVMPAVRYVKKGIQQPSAAKLVAGVIIAVGLRGVDLLKVRPRHVDLSVPDFLWPASEKGKGVPASREALSEEGAVAFRAYLAAGSPTFNPEAVSHSFKRAARRIDGPDTPIHLYTLRHGVGADTYRETRDLATVGRLLHHAEGSRATAQYARGANAAVDRAAVSAVSAARRAQLLRRSTPVEKVQGPEHKLPAQLPNVRKSHTQKRLQRVS